MNSLSLFFFLSFPLFTPIGGRPPAGHWAGPSKVTCKQKIVSVQMAITTKQTYVMVGSRHCACRRSIVWSVCLQSYGVRME